MQSINRAQDELRNWKIESSKYIDKQLEENSGRMSLLGSLRRLLVLFMSYELCEQNNVQWSSQGMEVENKSRHEINLKQILCSWLKYIHALEVLTDWDTNLVKNAFKKSTFCFKSIVFVYCWLHCWKYKFPTSQDRAAGPPNFTTTKCLPKYAHSIMHKRNQIRFTLIFFFTNMTDF